MLTRVASGTLAITYNAAVALPIANGGTGLITVGGANTFLTSNGTVYSWLGSTGTGNVVRTTSPTITSATAATAALTVTNTATGSPSLATFFGSATTAASFTFKRFGVNATLGNYTEERFNYTASASTSNNYEMRVTANSRFQITNNDVAPFTVTNPSGPFAVTGAISANSLALTVALPTTSGGTGRTDVGTVNQVLTSNGTSLVWQTPTTGTVTSVAASVPAFLSIAGSPINTSGTLSITLSGTPLPLANGGTGPFGAANTVLFSNGTVTSWLASTGTGNNVLATSPTLVTPTIGAATGTSLNLTGLTASQPVFTDAAKNLVSVAVVPTASGGTGLSSVGTAGQVLSSNGTSLVWALPSQTTTGTFTAVSVIVIPLPTTQSAKITISFVTTANTDLTLSGNTLITGAGTNLTVQEPYEQFQQMNGISLFSALGRIATTNALTVPGLVEITILSSTLGTIPRKQFFTNGVYCLNLVGSTRINTAGYLAITALSLIITPTTGTITGSWTIT